MRNMARALVTLTLTLSSTFGVTACGVRNPSTGLGFPPQNTDQSGEQPGNTADSNYQGDNPPSSHTQSPPSSQFEGLLDNPVVASLPASHATSTVDGVSATALPDVGLGTAPIWSSSGNTFAYASNTATGGYIIGTLHPLLLARVQFGSGAHVVAISDKRVIVSTSSFTQDAFYPLYINQTGIQFRTRQTWKAATDAWQHWVDTNGLPAVVTGGYKAGTLGLTLANRTIVKLGGGEVYLSPDRKFGAVAVRPRERRNVHPVGGEAVLTEHQPSDATSPIALWNFASPSGPKRLAVIHVPKVKLPSQAGPGLLQNVAFSPNDQYLAVLVQGEYATGPKLFGQTFVYRTIDGKLIGTAPYGSSAFWLPGANGLWLGTPLPAGQGNNTIVGTDGQILSVWPEGHANFILAPAYNKVVMFSWSPRRQLEVARAIPYKAGTSLGQPGQGQVFTGLPPLVNPNGTTISPAGHAAIAEFSTTPVLLQW